MPFLAVSIIRAYREEKVVSKELFELYQDVKLEPLHQANVYGPLLDHFEEHTPDVLEAEFYCVGDYWIKDEPYNGKAKIFLHQDKHAIAEIGVTLGYHYFELISFLENGNVVSSAKCESVAVFEKFGEHGMHIQASEAWSFLEMNDAHRQYLIDLALAQQSAIREIEPERWKEYFRYHNQKFGQVRFQLGEIKSSPDHCQFPEPSLSKGSNPQHYSGNRDLVAVD